MNIYQSEIDAGLSEQLSTKSSIVYASQVERSNQACNTKIKQEIIKLLKHMLVFKIVIYTTLNLF